MLIKYRAFIFLLALLVTGSAPALANPVSTENVTASLIAEGDGVTPGDSLWVALKLDIRDGWHTYWRNPGDSGQATSVEWQLPSGITAGDIHWPLPERQYVGPVANYGYHGAAYHLIELSVSDQVQTGQQLPLIAHAKWLVCEEECIPESARLEFSLKTSNSPALLEAHKAEFENTRRALPKTLDVQSGYQYLADGSGIRFEFSPNQKIVQAQTLEYFPYQWGVVQAPAEQTVIQDAAFVSIETTKGDLTHTKPVAGVLVAKSAEGTFTAYEVNSKAGPLVVDGFAPDSAANAAADPQFLLMQAVLFALLGGLILNLMPCVFPVLFMKALSLLSHAQGSARETRLHGLVYTLGVLVSFAVLALALMGVKASGQQVGWGFQLQSPLFVSIIAIVLFLLALSLSGYIKIGTQLMGFGDKLASQSGYSGSFFTGVLAVVVATPCTAPFMGPAIGFAFTQSAPITLIVLLALGLGLALPYLILSFFPIFARFLPKPGAWMQRVQELLAFPMYATVAWLIWVVSLQVGSNAVFLLLLTFILIAFAVWLRQSTKHSGPNWGRAGVLGVLICLGASGVMVQRISHSSKVETPTAGVSTTDSGLAYEDFNAQELKKLRSQNKPVFVNMTAAWCITCLANERVALSTDTVKTFFEDKGITYMKGDWTNQDEHITEYLKGFNRNSVPLYVYYPAYSDQATVLPQILTASIVIEEIEAVDSSSEPTASNLTSRAPKARL